MFLLFIPRYDPTIYRGENSQKTNTGFSPDLTDIQTNLEADAESIRDSMTQSFLEGGFLEKITLAKASS